MKIKNWLYLKIKTIPWLFSISKKIYHEILVPMRTGRAYYWVWYCITLRRKEIQKLSKLGFSEIKPYKHNDWRIGEDTDRAYRRFYMARKGNTVCFIKVGKHDKTVCNEIAVHKRIECKRFSFTPNCVMVDENFGKDTVMLALEFFEGLHYIPETASEKDITRICGQFISIFHNLSNVNLVHADIHRGNLMLDNRDNVVLLDFGISKFLNDENIIDYVERPGTFYRFVGTQRLYDDAYSFLQMLEKQIHISFLDAIEEVNQIKEMVDQQCFLIETNGK